MEGSILRRQTTRCHQVLEEGDKFESSFLWLDRCCFLALQGVDTHLLQPFWNALKFPPVRLAFQLEKESFFRANASQQDPGWEEG